MITIDEKLEQIALHKISDGRESFGGTPAISDGRLFIRSNKHLYCVAGNEQADDAVSGKVGDEASSGSDNSGSGVVLILLPSLTGWTGIKMVSWQVTRLVVR